MKALLMKYLDTLPGLGFWGIAARCHEFSLAVLLALGVVALVPATASAQSLDVPGVKPFPSALKNLQLGMMIDELRRLRPNARDTAFKGDNAGHPKLLFEVQSSSFYDRVIYMLADAAPVLTGVTFMKALPAADAGDLLVAHRLAVARDLGMPDEIRQARENGEAQTVLVWRGANAIVAASYPQVAVASGGGTGAARAVIVRIMRPALLEQASTVIGERAAVAVQRAVTAELQGSLRRGNAADAIRW